MKALRPSPPILVLSLCLAALPARAAERDFAAAESDASGHGRFALEASSAAIVSADLERYVARLASAEYEGRGTGDRGERMATAYLASFFRGLGLQPAGDDGSFFQEFEVTTGKELEGENVLELALDEPVGLLRRLEPGADFQPLSFSPSTSVESSPVVFAGFGIRAKDYDSYAGLDPRGRWVMVFRGSPKERKELERFGPLVAKAQLAKKLGAVGILFVKGPNPAVGKEVVPPSLNVGGGDGILPALSISDRLASVLLSGERGGGDFKTLFREYHEGGSVKHFPLPFRLAARIQLRQASTTGRNVLARLQAGGQPSAEAVVIGGHIDHLGYGNRGGTRAGGEDAEKLHFGADDNASGVAAIMELAQHFADRKRAGGLELRRDLVFAGWSGEEMGLHGSRHFVDSAATGEGDEKTLRPAVAAYINLDMVGRLGDKPLNVQGTGSSGDWEALLDGIETELKTKRSPSPYLPTDSSPFYSAGVPILALFTGLHDDYHTPADTVEKIDFGGLERISAYLRDVTAATAGLESAPAYVKVERGGPKVVLGVRIEDAPEGAGVRVVGVSADSPALRAGMQEGDVINRINGVQVTDQQGLRKALGRLKPDTEYPARVRREDMDLELSIVPAKRG